MSESVDTVLRLVAEGRLTAEEAAPILDALDGGAGSSARPTDPEPAGATRGDGAPSALRIEVRDHGRPMVNLRLPLALGRFAVDRVPGITGLQADRIREALRANVRGPILEVDEEDGSSVRIVLE